MHILSSFSGSMRSQTRDDGLPLPLTSVAKHASNYGRASTPQMCPRTRSAANLASPGIPAFMHRACHSCSNTAFVAGSGSPVYQPDTANTAHLHFGAGCFCVVACTADKYRHPATRHSEMRLASVPHSCDHETVVGAQKIDPHLSRHPVCRRKIVGNVRYGDLYFGHILTYVFRQL